MATVRRLRALCLPFKLSAQRPRLQRGKDLQGRVRFVLDDARSVIWAGAAGFVLRDSLGHNVAAATVPAVLAALQA